MIAIPSDRLDAILARHDIVTATLSAGEAEAESFVQLSRELSELDSVVEAIRAFRAAESALRGVEEMIEEGDPEMRALAAEEKRRPRPPATPPPGRFNSCSCPRMPPTRRAPSWRYAPAPAATRRRSSPATSSGCIRATPT